MVKTIGEPVPGHEENVGVGNSCGSGSAVDADAVATGANVAAPA